MKILIIGGKRFVGYHIAKACKARGHEIVFFNRGKTNSELFPKSKNIIGDRDTDMHKLENMKFDAVIDTCAYFPIQVEKSMKVLKDNIKRYLLISSLSVINPKEEGFDETVDLVDLDFNSTKITGETYGPLKAACEKQLVDMIGSDKSIIIRPGYIVGDRDYTDRFTYWPVMINHMKDMIIPKNDQLNFKYVDAKDLGDFVIGALEKELSGIYHLQGPKEPMKFIDFIKTCQRILNPSCRLIKVEDSWFENNDIIKSIAFPLFNDDQFGKTLYSGNPLKSYQYGFKSRDLEDTIMDAFNWYHDHKGDVNLLSVGMKPDQMKSYIKQLK
jgi:nucleoside-diphosphate-sugar epimerase